MAEMTTVVEGKVKYRDGKKWKPRWCVLKKPSPVADRLLVHLYKDVKDALRGGSAKSNFPLDNFYGLEAGLCYDKETSVLAIICQKQVVLFAFESREILIQFEIKIRRSLGEEHQFPVRVLKVPPQSKLPLDLVRMHIHGQKFCLTNGIPPKVLVSWNITELRRFGTVDGKFCFEGGSRCGKGAGVHVFMTDQAEDVADIVRLASVGRTPTMRRHTSKRRSEYLEPAKNSVSDNFKNFQNTQTYSVQNIQEDQTWMRPKRHSISFMDYRRGKSYMEKNRLISIENVEKERLMAIYDIPPRRIRKVESIQPEKQNREDMKTVQMNGRVQDVEHGAWCSGEYNNNVMSYQIPAPMAELHPKGSKHTEEDSIYGSQSSIQSGDNSLLSRINETNLKTVPMSSSAPALCGYGNVFMDQYNDCSQSMPYEIDEEIDQVAGLSHRRKALEKLQQEEIDLQREMSLLDEILQVCKIEENRHERSCQQKPPPLPLKGFKAGRKSEPPKGISFVDNISSSSYRSGGKPFSSGYSDSALLSPNLLNKLKKIPTGSKLLAPLPYVNLDKFDIGDVGADHVHMPASISAQCGGGNWSVRDKKSQGYDNVKNEDVISNKENSHLSVSLPVSRENLRLSGRSGSESRLAPKKSGQAVEEEPIYMNEKRRKSDTPPPELPPKGQYLLSRSRQKLNFTAHSRPPPPMPLDRKQLQCPSGSQDNNCLQYQRPRQYVNPIPSPSASEDSYFIMTSFAKEPVTCMTPSTESSCDMVAGRPIVKLLGWGSRHSSAIKSRSTTSSESEGYMDMSGIINTGNQSSTFFSTAGAESMCSDSFSTTSDSLSSLNPTHTSSSCSSSSRPKYFRSFSASSGADTNISLSPELCRARRPDSISISAGNSPRDMRREMVRDTNYMLMSGVLSPHRTVLDSQRSLQSFVQQTPGGGQDLSDKSQQFFPAAGEDNDGLYLRVQKEIQSGLDGNGLRKTDKDSVSKDITQESCDSGADSKPDVPFPNLIDFQQHAQCLLFKSEPDGDTSRSVPEIPTNSQQNVQALCSKPAFNAANEKTVLECPAKTPGFFTRLIRRNSKDRKIMSQSQENLLSTSSSETGLDKNITVKDGMSFTLVLSSSSSSASSRSQSHQELCLSSIKDRQRSSSFPNRSSFLAMTSDKSDHSSTSTGLSDLSNQSDLGATSSSLAGSESLSTFTSSSDGKGASGSQENVLSQKDCDSMENIVDSEGNYDSRSYFYIGPLQGRDQVKYGNETSSGHKVDEILSVEDEKSNLVPEESDTKVFTVLRVEDIPPKIPDCSKTDDEKLIELLRTGKVKEGKFDKESLSELKSKLTLPLEELLSPDQKAAAIARHISSLPPFVPPKMKSYPLCLSPVLESSPRKSLCEPEAESEEGGGTSGGLSEEFPTGSLAPALRKQQARATLRITPPSEDENGKIWIPRSSLPSQSSTNTVESSSVNSNNTSLVVDLSDLVEDTDDLSICSVDSSTHSEDAVRSSPASTILRPRFGKEYQKVERRRTTTDESSGTSPAITPHSPGAASVFTFEMPVAASETSTFTKDGEIQSPKFAKVTQLEQAFLSRSDRGTELIQSPRALYMNVDLSPPASPLPSTCSSLPAEQFEPQLNYAEIDLSDAGQTDSARKRSPVSKTPPSNIEYAMIDMVATAAAQKARKEHAQSREDSLRRDRKYSTSSLGAKERFGSLSLPSRKAATFAGQSSNSMDSTNF
ncbi:hypothetical protein CHS0354_035138 [Potamilus streckersoni]|uniref:IRS-type PTB domain-containing protein n=1 Tax=Potamilus streckersoni TaxID=2493646 RepID=A0AAE0WAV0_9BIVA|nr:hypothetical protein CHS0354_035138 [Potamilus streckersoni]